MWWRVGLVVSQDVIEEILQVREDGTCKYCILTHCLCTDTRPGPSQVRRVCLWVWVDGWVGGSVGVVLHPLSMYRHQARPLTSETYVCVYVCLG